MQQDGMAALRAQLRDQPPAGLSRLAEGELADLAEAVGEARARQAAELAAAGESALRVIPRLLRGPIRKVVGG
jgi:predicted ATPase with chaperone activity